MDRTFKHNVDAQISSRISLMNVVNKDVERERNRIASKKTRDKKKQNKLETLKMHGELVEQNRRLKDKEIKRKELINVMLNEIMVKKVENFFDAEIALMSIQNQTTNEHNDEYNRHADWQQESSYSTTTILLDNYFSCLK